MKILEKTDKTVVVQISEKDSKETIQKIQGSYNKNHWVYIPKINDWLKIRALLEYYFKVNHIREINFCVSKDCFRLKRSSALGRVIPMPDGIREVIEDRGEL